MYWVNFLHIYQPPGQHKDVLRQIVKESYEPLINILKRNPGGKLVLNIAACLTEQLIALGYKNLIEDLKELVKKGQVELTETSKYHAFLPLLPSKEIERQVELNQRTHKKIFGKLYQPKGFHLPEMAYSRRIVETIAKVGYFWLILNEISFGGKLFSKVDNTKIYRLKGLPKVKILFRNRKLSDLIQRGLMRETNDFYQFLEKESKENEYVITAIDGETFGHHRPGLEKFLEKLYEEKKVKAVTVSEIISYFPKGEEIEPLEGSWATMESEIKSKIPFAQWNYPKNPIHKNQWKLTYLAIKTLEKSQRDPNFRKARKLLDMALFSCQYWWAGAVPWWEIEYVEKGAYYLKKVIEILKNIPQETKEKAQKLYEKIVFTAFDWERSGLAHKKSMEYTKKIIKELKEQIPISALFSKR